MELIDELELNINPEMIKLNLTIKELNKLKDIYESEKKKGENRYDTIEAYHNWLVKSSTFFRNQLPAEDADLIVFTDVNSDQDGYGLSRAYNKQRYAYNNLISKIETQKSSDQIPSKSLNMKSKKRIFISHSSIDKEIIDQFIDKILKLGLHFSSDDIACTSREDMGVRTGDDIRNFIKDNISVADFVFFMISDNYKKSEICLNEMGAAWATDRNVKPILLPNIGFDSIGWLYNVNKGIAINDSSALDLLSEDICEKYDTKLKITTWNKHKIEFLKFITGIAQNEDATQAVVIYEKDEELDLLDCREIYDEKMAQSNENIRKIGNAFELGTENSNKNTIKLEALANNSHTTPAQIRTILLKMAHDTDKLSEVLETETPILKKNFEEAIIACLKMKQFVIENEQEQLNEEKKTIHSLIEDMTNFMHTAASVRAIFQKDSNNLDKSYSKAKTRLIKKLTDLIETMQFCINKANELVMSI